jgi:hypothetical protein
MRSWGIGTVPRQLGSIDIAKGKQVFSEGVENKTVSLK